MDMTAAARYRYPTLLQKYGKQIGLKFFFGHYSILRLVPKVFVVPFRVVPFRTPKSWSYVVWPLFVLVTIHAAV